MNESLRHCALPRGIALIAVATIAAIVVADSDASAQQVASRPILHLSLSGPGGGIRAVDIHGQEVARIEVPKGATGFLGWSPDGARFAYCRDTAVHVRGLRGNDVVVYESSEGVFCGGWLSPWSPDGRRLAIVTGARLWTSEPSQFRPGARRRVPARATLTIVDVNAKRAQKHIALPDWVAFMDGLDGGPPGITPYRISWSSDNRHVLVCWLQTVVVNADSGQVVMELRDRPLVEWTGKGDSVFHVVGTQSEAPRVKGDPSEELAIINRVDVRTGERTAILSAGDAAAFNFVKTSRMPHVVLSPSGRRLAMLGANPTWTAFSIFIFDLADGTEFAPFKPTVRLALEFWPVSIDWSPAEDALVAVTARGEVRVLDMAKSVWTTVGTIGKVRGAAEINALAFYKMVSWSR